MNENHLGDLLERATDDLPVRDRSGVALARARAVRRRRRAAGATAVAAVVAMVVTTPLLWSGQDGRSGPTPGPASLAPTLDTSPAGGGTIDPHAVPAWDPFSIADAEWGRSVLPESLEPPDTPPSVLEQPIAAAVVAWPEPGHDLRLLGTDGGWRSVPGTATAVTGTPSDVVRPELTSDGRSVAMSTDDGILVVDVTSGTRQLLPWPPQLTPPWDVVPPLLWLPGDDELIVEHWKQPWVVGLEGRDRQAPYRGQIVSNVFVDPDGSVREWQRQEKMLVEWEDDRIVRRVDGDWWGDRFVTRYGLVAFTGALEGDDRNGPAVVRAGDGAVVGYAPIDDPDSAYGDNGYLTAQGFLDDRTLLLLMAPVELGHPDREERWYLVAWDFIEGEFRRLSTGDATMRAIDVAEGAVR